MVSIDVLVTVGTTMITFFTLKILEKIYDSIKKPIKKYLFE